MIPTEIQQALKQAAALFGEAQAARDFCAQAQAAQMTVQARQHLLFAFENHLPLREQFPVHWQLLQQGDRNPEFSAADLERALRAQ